MGSLRGMSFRFVSIEGAEMDRKDGCRCSNLMRYHPPALLTGQCRAEYKNFK